MAVDTRDLTTLSRVSNAILRSDAEDALSDQVFASSGNFSDEGERGISSASGKVKSYLNRELIVAEKRTLLRDGDWEKRLRTPDDTYTYGLSFHRIKEWPVLSVNEDVKILGDRRIYAKDGSLSEVNYFGGYRRQDHVLSDFSSNIQSEFGSEDEIPVLPELIEDVVIHLSIHFAMLRISGLVGKTVSEQEIGDFQTTVRKHEADESFERSQLSRIQTERFFS